MRGKGVPKTIFFLVYFAVLGFSELAPKLVSIVFYNFWSQFWIPIFGVLDVLGAFWEPSWAS